jgi:hypothetical protein
MKSSITVITGGCRCNLVRILVSERSHTLSLHMFFAIVNNIKQEKFGSMIPHPRFWVKIIDGTNSENTIV